MELTSTPEFAKLICDKMSATLFRSTGTYRSGVESQRVHFNIYKHEVTVVRNGALFIDVKSSEEETIANMTEVLHYIMHLIQLSEGYFPHIAEIEWLNGDKLVYKVSNNEYKKFFIHFPTYHEYVSSKLRLLPMFDIFQMVDDTTFNKYQKLVNALSIQLNLFRFACSDNKLFVDLRCAFFIELFEPFALYERLVGENEKLKQSISSFILYYGQELFRTECENNLDFIPLMVKSRVGVMHAKLISNKKLGLTPCQCAFYNLKFQLLFRSYFLHKLGIDINSYKSYLEKAIGYAEKPSIDFDLISSFKKRESK